MTRILLALMWALHWLPLPFLAALGRGLGLLLYALVRERRRITLINLALCFPQLSAAEKSALARRHFAVLGRSLLELGLWWWAPAARIKRLVRLEGEEHLAAHRGKPVILLAPHFVALDAGGVRLGIDHAMVSIYARAKNRVFDGALRRGRERFGKLQRELVEPGSEFRRVGTGLAGTCLRGKSLLRRFLVGCAKALRLRRMGQHQFPGARGYAGFGTGQGLAVDAAESLDGR